MANYRGHVAGGFVAAAIYSTVIYLLPPLLTDGTYSIIENWLNLVFIFAICLMFGLFPDVDTNSKAQNLFYGIVFIADVILILGQNFISAAYLGLIALLPIIGHHRGWTHKKWAIILVPLPILIFPYIYDPQLLPLSAVYYGAAIVGYLSHLLLDKMLFSK